LLLGLIRARAKALGSKHRYLKNGSKFFHRYLSANAYFNFQFSKQKTKRFKKIFDHKEINHRKPDVAKFCQLGFFKEAKKTQKWQNLGLI
jgi:hypothetical protein